MVEVEKWLKYKSLLLKPIEAAAFTMEGNARAGCVKPVRLRESIRTKPRVAIIRRRVDLLFFFMLNPQ